MEGLLRGITLTPAQQAQVDSIREHYRSQMPAFTPGSPPDSATREKMREHFRHMTEDIRAVLTPDQQKVYDKNLARSEEHTSELQSRLHLVCRLLLEKKKHTA